METTIYQVIKNLNELVPLEIKCCRVSGCFYWDSSNRRNALDTNYYVSFTNKQDAINDLKWRIETKINHHKRCVDDYEAMLFKFNQLNNK